MGTTTQEQKNQTPSTAPLTSTHSSALPPLVRAPRLLRDEDHFRQDKAWHKALADIKALAIERKLKRKVFISYAWPPVGNERDQLQAWLKRLQDSLEQAGSAFFLICEICTGI